jgi:hypothetical protein
MKPDVHIFKEMPKWAPFVMYLEELHKITNVYRQYKNVTGAEVQLQPGRLIIYWAFPETDRRPQEIREFMEAVYNVNVSFIVVLKELMGVSIYHQELSYTDFFLRVDLLVPHHFPELVELQRSPVPWDLPKLIVTLDKRSGL